MSSSTDTVNLLKAIIEHLSSSPFNRTESLVSFSQLTPQQLIQLINDIATQLDNRHQIDLTTETSDITAHRLIDFVCVTLDYHPENAADFGRDLIAGITRVVYPLLYHLLSRFPQLKQRAYLARYVRPFECPAEYAADPVMSALIQQYHDKQYIFKETHKNVTKLRENATNVSAMKSDMKQLENEKLQLINKLNKIKDRIHTEHADDFEQDDHHHDHDDDDDHNHILQHDDDDDITTTGGGDRHHRRTSSSIHRTPLTAEGRYLAEMISATKALRQEQETENKLYQQKINQLNNIDKYNKLSNESEQALSQLKNITKNVLNNNNNDPTRLLSIMSRDVANQRAYITDELQPLLNSHEKSMKKIQSILSATAYTPDDLVEMSNNNKVLLNQIEHLTEQIESVHSSDGGRIALIRDRYNNLIKKNNIFLQELNDLESEKKEILDENDLILNKINDLSEKINLNPAINMNENEIKSYINTLSQQTNDYKNNKKNLESLNAELDVLKNTFVILKNQCSNLEKFQENLEKLHNLVGFKNLNNQLETLSLSKNNLDMSKLQTLDEISEIIIMIKEKLKTNKDILAPKIKNLRIIRNDYESLENNLLQAKKDENLRDLNYSTEREILKKENNQSFQELNLLQNNYFILQTQLNMLNAREITLKDANKTIINQLEQFTKENESFIHLLKKDKKLVKDKPADLSHQSEFFLIARNILQSKITQKELEVQEMERSSAAAMMPTTTAATVVSGGGYTGGGGFGRGGSDVLALAAEADRLVFD